ncbi:hypothetical protein RhiirA5_404131 [Rhizophagus irregularis]|uniref:MULE transposase domain-containing protein n=2 Tax=Rhizophagus irregularis TaxID=588596 RepID=A0A2N0NTG3_9GLOM|nr:hypothetical protein RhiirA5_404131 [Rhizophagus irregularis]
MKRQKENKKMEKGQNEMNRGPSKNKTHKTKRKNKEYIFIQSSLVAYLSTVMCILLQTLQILQILSPMQYFQGRPSGGGDTSIWCPFLGYHVKKYIRTCQGIKAYEHLNEDLRNKVHTEVDMDQDFYQTPSEAALEQRTKEAKTYLIYISSATEEWFIGCSNWCDKVKKGKHYFEKLKNDVDPELLGRLFNGENLESIGEIGEANSCNVILSSNSRRKTCGFLHQHSDDRIKEGRIVEHKCKNKFYKIIPLDLKKTPYVILISKGIHTHHPPPPSNVPSDITEKLKKMIEVESEELVNITARKLISATFSNGHIMVICMSEVMAHAWTKLEYFEIDLSFKRVQGDINEFEVNCYDSQHNMSLTYAHVFTNIADAIAYERMFNALFDWIYQLTGNKPQIYHIHQKGWKCILGDLDQAQAKGLGMALHKIHNSLTWEEHLLHIFKSCHIHYNRNVKNNKYSYQLKKLMYEFPNASTTERVNQIFEELEASDESIIKDWIAFYSKPWVRASLNPIYSFIALDIWQNAPDNTNVAESCHANCNRDGKALPLEAAILKAKNYDERQFISCDIHNCYGVAKSGKDQGVVA